MHERYFFTSQKISQFCFQSLLLISMDFADSSSKSDDASNDASAISNMSFAEDLCIASLALSFRADRLVVTRMNWHQNAQSLLHENLFHINYQMSIKSFNQLLDLLSPKLHLKDNHSLYQQAFILPLSVAYH